MFVVPNLHKNGSENGITSWADMFGWNESTCNNIVLSSTSREGMR
ncbi:hypothetical protein MAR_019188 [Mya arenaria]|uniref:Uncharacterized protein n=1 Tax=Mya arenaria TaxID=6604 RepID=A0ABY7EGW2_MYAAR|nr:hypothetical protein MAR_019188 [Mya arenaria]